MQLITNTLPKLKPQFTWNVTGRTTEIGLRFLTYIAKILMYKKVINQNRPSIGYTSTILTVLNTEGRLL
jgi:hypothetical protein